MFITKEKREEYEISGNSEISNECGNQEIPEIESEKDEKIKNADDYPFIWKFLVCLDEPRIKKSYYRSVCLLMYSRFANQCVSYEEWKTISDLSKTRKEGR